MTQQPSVHPEDTAYRDLVLPYIDALRHLVAAIENLHYLGRLPVLPCTLQVAFQEARAAVETWDELSDTC